MAKYIHPKPRYGNAPQQRGFSVQNIPNIGSIRLVDLSNNTGIVNVDISKAKPAEGIPVGAIVMFQGDMNTLPTFWRFCDGTHGTPNLRNKFILGASKASKTSKTGGYANSPLIKHTHTVASKTSEAPNHVHSFSVKDTWSSANGKHAHTAHRSINGNMRVKSHTFPGKWYNYGSDNWHGMSKAGKHKDKVTTKSFPLSDKGSHTHKVTISTDGSNGSNANLPPYYKLAYIMKEK